MVATDVCFCFPHPLSIMPSVPDGWPGLVTSIWSMPSGFQLRLSDDEDWQGRLGCLLPWHLLCWVTIGDTLIQLLPGGSIFTVFSLRFLVSSLTDCPLRLWNSFLILLLLNSTLSIVASLILTTLLWIIHFLNSSPITQFQCALCFLLEP